MGKWSKVREVLSKPDYSIDPFSGTAPKGMTPSSIPGIYTTPEVIEPTDCDNYPDSIFCGGNPVNNTPLDLDIEINADRCGVSVRAKPTIGYFKFPSFGAAYVTPECRNEPKPYKNPNSFNGLENKNEIAGFDRPISDSEIVYAGITQLEIIYREISCGVGRPNVFVWSGRYSNGQTLQYGYDRTYNPQGNKIIPVNVYGQSVCQDLGYNSSAACGTSNGDVYQLDDPFIATVEFNHTEDLNTYILTINNDGDVYSKYTVGGTQIEYHPERQKLPHHTIYYEGWAFDRNELHVVYGQWGDIKKRYQYLYNSVVEGSVDLVHAYVMTCYDVLRPNEVPTHKYNEYPDTFNPVKRCECMGCCSSSPYEDAKKKEQDRKRDECCDELKKLIKEVKTILGTGKPKIEYYDIDPEKQDAQKKTVTPKDLTLAIEELSKLHKITQQAIGVDEYPIQYPDSIVEPINDNILGQVWDFLTPDKTRKITSLAQMLDWMVDQQSATIGKLQRKIESEVEDNRVQSDGSIKKNTKKVSVVLPDLATALEEIYKMNVQIIKALGMNTDIGIKGLQESVNTSVMSAETIQRIKTIQEFLSFPTNHTSTDLPIQITIPEKGKEKDVEKDLLAYLQPSNQKVVWDDFDGSQTLYEMLTDLMNAAAIIRAVYYGRV